MNFKAYTALSGKIYLKTIREKFSTCGEDDFESLFYNIPEIASAV